MPRRLQSRRTPRTATQPRSSAVECRRQMATPHASEPSHARNQSGARSAAARRTRAPTPRTTTGSAPTCPRTPPGGRRTRPAPRRRAWRGSRFHPEMTAPAALEASGTSILQELRVRRYPRVSSAAKSLSFVDQPPVNARCPPFSRRRPSAQSSASGAGCPWTSIQPRASPMSSTSTYTPSPIRASLPTSTVGQVHSIGDFGGIDAFRRVLAHQSRDLRRVVLGGRTQRAHSAGTSESSADART